MQDSRMAYNPPEVAKRLLTAECPTEVQERLVNASSRLAQDPSMLKSLIKVVRHPAATQLQTPVLSCAFSLFRHHQFIYTCITMK